MSRWPAIAVEDAADRLGITTGAVERVVDTFEDDDGIPLVSVLALAVETKIDVSILLEMFAGYLIEDPDFGR